MDIPKIIHNWLIDNYQSIGYNFHYISHEEADDHMCDCCSYMWKDLEDTRHWVTIGYLYDGAEVSIVQTRFLVSGSGMKAVGDHKKEVVISMADPDMYNRLAEIIHTSGGYLMGSASVL